MGEGVKPASVQPFITDMVKLRSYTVPQLAAKAADDPEFARDLRALQAGYRKMLRDDIGPDFGGGNLVVSGSNILVLDTGLVPTADKIRKSKKKVPDYELVESIRIPEVVN